jgi:hypothetical protein
MQTMTVISKTYPCFLLTAEGKGLQPFDPADNGDRILIYGSTILQKNL